LHLCSRNNLCARLPTQVLVIFLLAIVSLVMGSLATCFEILMYNARLIPKLIAKSVASTVGAFFLNLLHCCGLLLLSCLITQFIGPNAKGIPLNHSFSDELDFVCFAYFVLILLVVLSVLTSRFWDSRNESVVVRLLGARLSECEYSHHQNIWIGLCTRYASIESRKGTFLYCFAFFIVFALLFQCILM
jgi:hypothetical protein